MKTKMLFFGAIFIAFVTNLYASHTHLYLEDIQTNPSFYYCSTEYDSLIIHRPENGNTDPIWETPDIELIEDQDSVIVLSSDQNGHWCFYSEETEFIDFFIYFVDPAYEPGNFEDLNICTFSFSRILDAQNTESYSTYLWSTGQTTRTISVDVPDTYTVTITNACGDEIFSKTITQGNPNAPNLGSDQEFCLGESTTLDPQSINVTSTLWSTGATTSEIIVSESGSYWVHIEDENGCNGRDTINITIIQTPSQEILLATINTDPLDPNYGNNMITWEVDPLLVNSIDSVYIYREMGTNNYVLVGGTEYTDEEWSDEVNSIAHAWKYKISLVGDPCGESVSSSSVQTIHSWVSEFGGNYTIQWDPYVVDAKTTVTWYKILSGNELNTLTVRDSVSGSLHSVTLPSTTDSIFVVGAELNGAKSFNGLALSNKTPNPTVTRVTTKTIAPIFLIYPNPAFSELNIDIGHEDFQIEVSTMLGQVVLTEYNVKTLNVSPLPQGIYIISVSADGIVTKKKFVKN